MTKLIGQSFIGDKNEKMIEVLQQPSAVGSFLFFLYGKIGEQEPGFIFPLGLSEEEAKEFSWEFLALFGKYAKKAEERKQNAK